MIGLCRMISAVVVSSIAVIGASSTAWSFDLTVRVLGATPGTGQILASLFNSHGSYMSKPYRDNIALVDGAGISTTVFKELPAGDYAVSLIYDDDSDGELDTNFVGIPTEAFGFSNNATAFFGPPDWAGAAFSLQNDLMIEIKLDTADE